MKGNGRQAPDEHPLRLRVRPFLAASGFQTSHVTQSQGAMSRKYQYIEHTGDLGFKAYGATREELFVHAAEALFDVLVSVETVKAREQRTVAVEATAPDELMVSWLGELLFLFETQGLLLTKFEINTMEENRVEATVRGEIMDPTRQEIKTGVKAVTYHQLYVKKRNGLWESQVILDL